MYILVHYPSRHPPPHPPSIFFYFCAPLSSLNLKRFYVTTLELICTLTFNEVLKEEGCRCPCVRVCLCLCEDKHVFSGFKMSLLSSRLAWRDPDCSDKGHRVKGGMKVSFPASMSWRINAIRRTQGSSKQSEWQRSVERRKMPDSNIGKVNKMCEMEMPAKGYIHKSFRCHIDVL